jgi:hypothetical protein
MSKTYSIEFLCLDSKGRISLRDSDEFLHLRRWDRGFALRENSQDDRKNLFNYL